VVAERLVAKLEQSGYVIMRKLDELSRRDWSKLGPSGDKT
jgi:hypothetical protein